MTTDETKNNNKSIISLVTVKDAKEAEEIADLIRQGSEVFKTETEKEDCVAFLALVFDKSESYKMICAGDIDLLTTVGALEVTKHELFKTTDVLLY